MTATVPDDQLYVAGGLLKAFRRLRDIHPEMTILQAMCFLVVVQRPGITQKQLSAEVDASDSATSRILAALSDLGDRKAPGGFDLIRMVPDVQDRRLRLVFLTRKGARLLADIADDIGKSVTEQIEVSSVS
jgi:DNA-binding MarR family transcriptional regulator